MATIIGTQGADTLVGTNQPDRIEGLAGNDVIDGGGGADLLVGGMGDDTYFVDSGDEIDEDEDEGFDTIYVQASYVLATGLSIELLSPFSIANQGSINITGNELGNIIVGSNGDNTLSGGAGNDYLEGFGGINLLLGGDGDDRLYGSGRLEGDAGNDYLAGGVGSDVLIGGAGDDIYIVNTRNLAGLITKDEIYESADNGFDIAYAVSDYNLGDHAFVEVLSAYSIANGGDMNLGGNDHDNVVVGTLGINILNGGDGNDQLYAYSGSDILGGGGGNDLLFGHDDDDRLFGGPGTDFLDGGPGADTMEGGGDSDSYIVDDAADAVREEDGAFDIVYALADYTLPEGAGLVELLSSFSIANQGALNLTGNSEINAIAGTNGANTIDGKAGNDWLVGFGGADTFRFTAALNSASNVDVIQDFESGLDVLALDHAVFVGLAPGGVPASSFVIGLTAADPDDRIIYDSVNGRLFFDADGSGAGSAVLFASFFGARPNLAATDLIVI